MNEVEAASWFRYVSMVVHALDSVSIRNDPNIMKVIEATRILWSCYEDCALSDPPRWTIKQHMEDK